MIRFECGTNVDVNALNKAFFTMKNTGCTGYKIIISEQPDFKVTHYEETQIVNDDYTIDIFINETLKDNVTDLVIEQVKTSQFSHFLTCYPKDCENVCGCGESFNLHIREVNAT
tara:strand:- start:125 stop:466 length:342 start_codon:yes stop_codon:yes gene_type:complete